jgi:hypothetical protein
MKWPFVSRGAYDALERERNQLNYRLDVMIDRNNKLVDEVMRFRREGFNAAPPEPVAPPAAPSLPDEVQQALDDVGLMGSTRAQMEAWAWRQLARERSAKDVADDLRAGGLREAARA